MTSFIHITIAAAIVPGRRVVMGVADAGIANRAADHAKRDEQPENPSGGSS